MNEYAFIPGHPVPQGSMRAFAKGGRAWVTYTNPTRMKAWRNQIAEAFPAEPNLEPYIVVLHFVIRRPKSMPKKESNIHTKRPDLDKLTRAVLDALTGRVWKDDSQVVSLTVSKRYGPEPGVYISIADLGEPES